MPTSHYETLETFRETNEFPRDIVMKQAACKLFCMLERYLAFIENIILKGV